MKMTLRIDVEIDVDETTMAKAEEDTDVLCPLVEQAVMNQNYVIVDVVDAKEDEA